MHREHICIKAKIGTVFFFLLCIGILNKIGKKIWNIEQIAGKKKKQS